MLSDPTSDKNTVNHSQPSGFSPVLPIVKAERCELLFQNITISRRFGFHHTYSKSGNVVNDFKSEFVCNIGCLNNLLVV